MILACGNTLRGDDGIGPWLAEWAEERFGDEVGVRVIASHQWSPDMAEDIASSETVLFIDCSLDEAAGQVLLRELAAAPLKPGLVTHHLGAPELLHTAQELFGSRPRRAFLLTVGAGSIELGEEFSGAMKAAVPNACRLLDETVVRLLAES